MRLVLYSEICKERPNKAALGAFNRGGGGGGGGGGASSSKATTASSKGGGGASASSFGVQKDGSFVASNLKQFGGKVDAMASQKNPGSVKLKGRDGNLQTKVEKSANLYIVTKYTKGKASRKDKIKKSDFEQNYRWHI